MINMEGKKTGQQCVKLGFCRFITEIPTNFHIALFFSIGLLDHILIHNFFVNFNALEDVTNYTVSCETVSMLALY
jgi:hypothetical protein